VRFTTPFSKHTQCIFPIRNSVNDFFRNERHARCNLFPRTRDEARSAEIFVGFLCLGSKGFISVVKNLSA